MQHECIQQERIDKYDEIISRFDKFIAVIETRNEYDKINQAETSQMLKELLQTKTEHDKRITVLEVLPAQVKDIQESRTIKTDKWITSKLSLAVGGGLIAAVVGVLISFVLFLDKIIKIASTIPK